MKSIIEMQERFIKSIEEDISRSKKTVETLSISIPLMEEYLADQKKHLADMIKQEEQSNAMQSLQD